MTEETMTDKKTMNKPAMNAGLALRLEVNGQPVSREVWLQMEARLRVLLTKHFPTIPCPALLTLEATERALVLAFIAGGIAIVRRGHSWDPDAPTEEGRATRRRLERNSRMICRLLYTGLVRRGELTRRQSEG